MKKFLISVLLIGLAINAQSQIVYGEMAKLVASDRASNDRYGYTLAIDGDYAVIGAYQEDEDETGSNTLSNAGSIYVYERDLNGNWIEVQKIVPSDRALSDNFGYSVAISGNYLVVGAYQEDEDEAGMNTLSNAGSAYIYERDGGGTWNEVQKIVASDRGAGDSFGYAVSISGDYLVVGAFAESEDEFGGNTMAQSGSAYVFERDGGGTWNEVQKLVASDRAVGDLLGTSVSISGTYLVLTARGEDEDEAGLNTLTGAGSAYVFERDGGGTWNEVQKIVASDRDANDIFGAYASIDGTYLMVGAYQEDEDASGSNTLSGAGSVYVFERDGGGVWNEVQKIVPSDRADNDNFGWAVSVNGNNAIVGAYREDEDANGGNTQSSAGSAYIFERDGGGTWNQVQKIVASDRAADDYYGSAVDASGTDFWVGAYREDEDENGANTLLGSGSAYVYEYCMTTSSYNITICDSYTVPSGDETHTTSGVYTDTIPNAQGCDSVMTINLTILQSTTNTINEVVCLSYTVPSGDETYTVNGTYTDTIPNAAGCDSIITINLTVNNSSSTINESACFSYTVPSGDETYFTSGTFVDTIPNVAGCDSVITINLSINNTSSVIDEFACASYTVPSGDETYFTTGTYSDTIPNTAGCDSIITINLTIGNSSSAINESACSSYTVPNGDETYFSSGTFMDTIPNMAGCDSIITINLTIGSTSSAITEVVCDSYTVPSGDESYTTSGIYTDTIPNTAGCDSIITVNLTVNYSSTNILNVDACDSYTVPSGDETYSISGSYTDTIPNASGCDSILFINLTINTVNVDVTQNGPELTANANGATYQWIDCNNGNQPINGETNQTFSATANGDYAVIVTENNCSDTSACYNVHDVGFGDLSVDPGMKIYPNPNSGEFTISTSNFCEDCLIEIYDQLGEVVYSGQITNENINVDLTHLNNGIYFLRIKTEAGIFVEQVVIQR